MTPTATRVPIGSVLPLRVRYLQEMDCQVVHDSLHSRPGWTTTYSLSVDASVAGFGTVAVGGPWKDKAAIFEFYVLPAYRDRAFELFECLLEASGARFMEIQSNDALPAVMLHAYAREISSEKIVFRDGVMSDLRVAGDVSLEQLTPEYEIRQAMAGRSGGGEWRLHVDGSVAATGGILFHYNHPYGDIYMDVAEPFRRRGLGSYLVQELKRCAYELGAVPCARCSPDNVASRATLQKAGFVPYAHILTGAVRSASIS